MSGIVETLTPFRIELNPGIEPLSSGTHRSLIGVSTHERGLLCLENKLRKHEMARARVLRNKAFVNNYKAKHGCMNCGIKEPLMLDFDHVKGEKKYSISSMVVTGRSIKSIWEEMKKCEVVCANCHRIRTHNRRQSSVRTTEFAPHEDKISAERHTFNLSRNTK